MPPKNEDEEEIEITSNNHQIKISYEEKRRRRNAVCNKFCVTNVLSNINPIASFCVSLFKKVREQYVCIQCCKMRWASICVLRKARVRTLFTISLCEIVILFYVFKSYVLSARKKRYNLQYYQLCIHRSYSLVCVPDISKIMNRKSNIIFFWIMWNLW